MRFLLVFVLVLAVGASSLDARSNLAPSNPLKGSNSYEFQNNLFHNVDTFRVVQENNQIYSEQNGSQSLNFAQTEKLKRGIEESQTEGKLRVSACGGDSNANSNGNGGCVCKNGWQKSGAGPCVACNTIDLYYVGDQKGGCQCRLGYKFANNKCRACNYFDHNSKADSNGVCQCNINFVNDTEGTGLCKLCTFFDVFSQSDGQGGCECINGYTKSNLGKCITCAAYKADTIGNKAGGCVCKNGFKNISDTCVSCSSLHGKAIGDNSGGCVCINHFEMVGNTCGRCDINDKYRQGDGKGGCKCIDKFQVIGGKCADTCPTLDPKSVYSDLDADCICIPNFKKATDQKCEDACKDMDPYSVYDQEKKECACIPLFQKDQAGKCQDTCPQTDEHSEYDTGSRKCQCLPNFSNQSNFCKHKCYEVELFAPVSDDSPLCKCVNNYYFQGSDCLKCSDTFPNTRGDGFGHCKCLQGYGEIDGVCKLCVENDDNSRADDLKSCLCKDGFQFSTLTKKCEDSCTAVDPKSFFDEGGSGQCACVFYHQNISGKCQDSCLALPNKVGDGSGNCQCQNGMFHMKDGSCKACPEILENTIRDSISGKCVCAPGFGIIKGECKNCTLVDENSQSGENSQCVCRALFYYSGITGKCIPSCTTTDLNSEYDAQQDKCICKQFYTRIAGRCLDQCFLQANKTGDGTGQCFCQRDYAYSLPNPSECHLCLDIYPNMTGLGKNTCQCRPDYFYSALRKGCFLPGDIDRRLYFDKTANKLKCSAHFIYNEAQEKCIDNCPVELTNSVFDKTTGLCSCRLGYTKQGSTCIHSCSGGRSPNENGYCVCPNGTYFNTSNNCVPCKNGFGSNYIEDHGCTCQEGYGLWFYSCFALCFGNPFDNSIKLNGICFCSPFHTALDQNFICRPNCAGTYTQNSQYDIVSKTCICSPGYKLNQVTKKCLIVCTDLKQIPNAAGVCVCKPGYTGSPPNCYDPCVLRSNEITAGIVDICKCKPGFYRKSGTCVLCNATYGNTTDDGAGFCQCLPDYFSTSTGTSLHCTLCTQTTPGSYRRPTDQARCYCPGGFTNMSISGGPFLCHNSCDNLGKAHYSNTRKDCVCNEGYEMSNHYCIQVCGKYDPNEQYHSISQKCVCKEHFVKNSIGKCQDKCQIADQNSIYSIGQGKCICSTLDFVMKNSRCVHKCYQQSNKMPDSNGNCVCDRQSFQYQTVCFKCSDYFGQYSEGDENGYCRCKKGYKNLWKYRSTTVILCSPCSTGDSKSEPGDFYECKCKEGFEFVIATESCQDSCKIKDANSQFSQEQRKCVCSSGYENITGVCQDKCLREPFTVKDGLGGCRCVTGRVKVNGVCETCDVALKNGVQHSVGSFCECQQGYAENIFGFCVKCDELWMYEWQSSVCSCKDGFWDLRKGNCVPFCLLTVFNSVFDEGKQDCVCGQGFVNSSNTCVPKCSLVEGSTANAKGDCKCQYGFGIVNNKCEKCSEYIENFVWLSDSTCGCSQGLKYQEESNTCEDDCRNAGDPNSYYDFAKKKCECLEGYQNSTGFCGDACLLSDANSVMNGDSCRCIDNFGRHKTQQKCLLCSSLGANWISDSTGNCICADNYYATQSKSCALCTSVDKNMIGDNKGGCICRNNYYRQNPQSQCKLCSSKDSNLIGDNSGGCVCKPNTQIDYKDGLCKACSAIDANSIFDKINSKCICKIKFFNDTTVSGKCQNCSYYDANKILTSDNSACVCANNYIEVDGKCKLCSEEIPFSQGNKAGACACLNHYTNRSNTCVLCSSLYSDSVGNGAGGCRCQNGFGNNTGVCLKCDKITGNSYSDNLGNCVCQKGYVNPPNCVLPV